VLKAASKAGLKFSPSKCHFAYASLKLLGRRVSTEGLEVLQDKLAAVRDLKTPTKLRDLWHVLGLFGYYRNFIRRYSIIAAPLTSLMKGIKPDRKEDGSYTHRMGETPIEWNQECQHQEKYKRAARSVAWGRVGLRAGIACARRSVASGEKRGIDVGKSGTAWEAWRFVRSVHPPWGKYRSPEERGEV
jgi:hypothetical protein